MTSESDFFLRQTRRQLLTSGGTGVGLAALHSLLAKNGYSAESDSRPSSE